MANFFRQVQRNQVKSKFQNKYVREAWHNGEESAKKKRDEDLERAKKNRKKQI